MHPKLGIRRKSNSKNWILRENPAFTRKYIIHKRKKNNEIIKPNQSNPQKKNDFV